MGRFRKAWDALRGRVEVAPYTPPVVVGTDMRVSDTTLAEFSITGRPPVNPWALPRAAPFAPAASDGTQAQLAMDSALVPSGGGIADIYQWAMNGAFSEGLGFLGYPYLAELTQRPEYRRVSEIFAAETTRKWIKLKGDEKRIDLIMEKLDAHDIRGLFRRAGELDGFFGRAQIFVDLGDRLDSDELAKPLAPKAKINGKGRARIKNFKVIEPFWSYPGMYQSANPLDMEFYKPTQWYVMSTVVHSTRLLTIVGREMPDMLKPAYSFGGLSLSQMIKPYVDNWLRTRQSVSDLLHSFSTMVLATDMSAVIAGKSPKGFLDRLQIYNQARDNRGILAINKDTEELSNVSTPLGTLDKLLAQSQEQIASVSGIPLVILLGVTPSGLNASSDGEVRTFYATIKSYQERVYRSPLATIIDLIQLDIDGKIDQEITFEFIDLWEMDEKDKALVRKSDADMDVAYCAAGIVDNTEVRARIVQDENSPYYGAELSEDAPMMPADREDQRADLENDEDDNDGPDDDGPGGAQDAAFEEGKHPRAENGQFGSGGSSGGAGGAPGASSAPAPSPKPVNPAIAQTLGSAGVSNLQRLIADKSSTSAEIMKALKPLDDAQRQMEPTIPHDQTPTEAFWNSRRYADGKNYSETIDGLIATAEKYAGTGGVKQERKARILLGPPAAGKSTSAERIAETEGYAIVDSDDAKKVIPEFEGGLGASAVHEESGFMGAEVLAEMMGKGDNVILPLVGSSPASIEKRIDVLKKAGYAVTVDLVDVDPNEAARRMASRALRSGRHISSGYFMSIGDKPKQTYDGLKAKYSDLGFGTINGNGGPKDEHYTEAVNHPTAVHGHKLFM